MTLINFLILYFFNLLLDYPLQGDFLAKNKSNNNYVLFVHSAIWGIGLSLVLMYLGLFEWWKVIFLVAGHFIIDYWKCRGLYKDLDMKDLTAYYYDQGIHILQVVLVLVIN